ncbi:MAG: sigma-54 dependent transcriptional regulator [Myxococcota bacterium]
MAELTPASVKGRRLLVVDDEEGMRHMLGLVLARHGYIVSEASNGVEAFERICGGDIDVVLADVRMPELDGLGLLKKIHAAKVPTTVIMMSAFVDLETAVEALKMGAADYVSKPFKADEVLLKIRMAEERARLEEEKARLQAENARLRGESPDEPPSGIVGKSQRVAEIFKVIRKVADYKSTVLLVGESGTGKELVARALHDQSVRRDAPFVPINCGAIPEALLESELFGHVKGAFTDASRTKTGLIEEASTGTLFLDEIGELPLTLQVKLLRFLQEDEIRRVGDTHAIAVDVRVVAATARDLTQMVKAGTFREDLYYRLNVLQLRIPPLRERKDDIPLLVDHFVTKYAARLRRDDMTVSRDALRALMDYAWPGNIRELENTIERAMVLADANHIDVHDLPERLRDDRAELPLSFLGDNLSVKKAVRTIERELIRRALEKTSGNRTRAAELLEISHRALLYKIKEYGLT